ncbi:cupredoxin domain-containing protein [Priestia abyssalis]|uniref:hypothetical protein n=1 Tax=Priestia abyssalis TaxID=1221450 RepID=UPI002E26FC7B
MFQYPEEDIATVNYVEIPEDKPVQFVLTSDAPMNSFWVPQLGGQVYTMPGVAEKMSFSSIPPLLFYDTVMKNGGEYMEHNAKTSLEALCGLRYGPNFESK